MKTMLYTLIRTSLVLTLAVISFNCKKEENNPAGSNTPSGWSQTSFPSLRVNSIASNTAGTLFVGTDSNGVYKSTDVGVTWTQTNNGLTQSHINAAYMDNVAGKLYVGTGAASIFVSPDLGATWQEIDPFASSNADVYSIAVNAKGDIFAGTNLGMVLRTTNGGSLWTALTISTSIPVIYSLAIDTGGTVYAGTSSSIAYSTNNGNSWRRPTTSCSGQNVLALCLSTDGYVWAGTRSQGLHVSADRGGNWSASSFNSGCINAIAMSSSGKLLLGTLSTGVYCSSDKGTACTTFNDGLTDLDVLALCVHPSGKLFAGTKHGVFVVAL